MDSASAHGFSDGFLIDKGTPLDGHVAVSDAPNNQSVVIPTQVLAQEHATFAQNSGDAGTFDPTTFGKSYGKATSVLSAAGITKVPGQNTVNVGVGFDGSPTYSDASLANNPDVTTGKHSIVGSGIALGAMGAFQSNDEVGKYLAIGNSAADPATHQKLDDLKNAQNPSAFNTALGANIDPYTGHKLYENWNSLSPAQKSIGVAGAGIHGFTFNDGQTFETKKITPVIPGVPPLSASDGLQLATSGVNVAPATAKWNQISAIQQTLFDPKNPNDTVHTANSLGLLGYDRSGKAVPLSDSQMSANKLTPAPHYGVGAATMDAGGGTPEGYSIVGQAGGKNVVAPSLNRGSVVLNAPEVASKSAATIYRSWNKVPDVRQTQGTVGGSALSGGLDAMKATNPYTLGAVVTHASLQHVDPAGRDNDLSHVSQIANISLNRLTTGDATKSSDSKMNYAVHDGSFNEAGYSSAMKDIRGQYAKQGISSKEIGYQLANQGYSEGRFDESQHAALHRSLDMVFDKGSYTIAQKLNTGKSKGISILEARRGGTV